MRCCVDSKLDEPLHCIASSSFLASHRLARPRANGAGLKQPLSAADGTWVWESRVTAESEDLMVSTGWTAIIDSVARVARCASNSTSRLFNLDELFVDMGLIRHVRRAWELPPRVAIRKAFALGVRKWHDALTRSRDARRSTYAIDILSARRLGEASLTSLPSRGLGVGSTFALQSYYLPLSDELVKSRAAEIVALVTHVRAHRFDLLGSGWVRVHHGVRARGLRDFDPLPAMPAVHTDVKGRWLEHRISESNLAESRRIWQFIDGDYQAIDWQLDFKSGHRWSERTWARDIELFPRLGSDIKVPWELSRMQHLPWLAAGSRLAQLEGQSARAQELRREFCNQITDFVATNPPRFGVNWCSTMDVALRVVSWLVAYDLFRFDEASFEAEWQRMFFRSVAEHGQHIVSHLEWDPQVRGNHYLADLCGLVFVAAYLPPSEVSGRWLRFATAEFLDECQLQFNSDGGNFEASTSYHRFSGEMVVQTSALLSVLDESKRSWLIASPESNSSSHRVAWSSLGLSPGPIPPRSDREMWPIPAEHRRLIVDIGMFSASLQGDRGPMPMFGDDDSGHFLKILPQLRRMTGKQASDRFLNLCGRPGVPADGDYWVEVDEDHRQLVDCIARLGGARCSAMTGSELPSEARLDLLRASPRGEDDNDSLLTTSKNDDRARISAFPSTGFFVAERGPFQLVFRCGPNGQAGNGGHAHNDQLSLALKIDGVELFIDAGTYLYSAAPDRRNHFRSTAVHNCMQVDDLEQNEWQPGTAGLFRLVDRAQARLTRFDSDAVSAEHDLPHFVGQSRRATPSDRSVRRQLEWHGLQLHGVDHCQGHKRLRVGFLLAPEVTTLDFNNGSVRLRCGQRRARLCWLAAQGGLEHAYVSRGYGRLEATRRIVLSSDGDEICWRLEVDA